MTFFIGKNSMQKKLLLPVICLLLSTACSQAETNPTSNVTSPIPGEAKMTAKESKTWHEVTVKFLDFEGGFYGLVASNGEKYLPMNLAKEYKLPGTVLKVQGHIIKDMITTQQWGQVFKITDIKLIKLGKAKSENTF